MTGVFLWWSYNCCLFVVVCGAEDRSFRSHGKKYVTRFPQQSFGSTTDETNDDEMVQEDNDYQGYLLDESSSEYDDESTNEPLFVNTGLSDSFLSSENVWFSSENGEEERILAALNDEKEATASEEEEEEHSAHELMDQQHQQEHRRRIAKSNVHPKQWSGTTTARDDSNASPASPRRQKRIRISNSFQGHKPAAHVIRDKLLDLSSIDLVNIPREYVYQPHGSKRTHPPHPSSKPNEDQQQRPETTEVATHATNQHKHNGQQYGTLPTQPEQRQEQQQPLSSIKSGTAGKTGSTTAPIMVAGPWVRKLLASQAAKEEKLMLVPLDFWMDPFNLAQLAPVVEQIVHRSRTKRQSTSDRKESSTVKTKNEGFPLGGNTSTIQMTQLQKQQQKQQNSPHSFPIYRRALQLITSQEEDDQEQLMQQQKLSNAELSSEHPEASWANEFDKDEIEMAAVVLYCFVHQRYIVSPRGLEALRRRFLLNNHPNSLEDGDSISSSRLTNRGSTPVNALFGRCPRPSCLGMPLLPAGLDDYQPPSIQSSDSSSPPRSSLRYCAKCHKYWVHYWSCESMASSKPATETATKALPSFAHYIQDCAWGLSLGPLFQLSFPGFLRPTPTSSETIQRSLPPNEPRIFGFRIHPFALTNSSLRDNQW